MDSHMRSQMDSQMLDRARGCAVGAVVGDALGMPLEFDFARPPHRLVSEMQKGRLPAGSFTDDTEMALALAESLLRRCPLDPADLAQRFVVWYEAGPPDVGLHTSRVLSRIAAGQPWAEAVQAIQRHKPEAAGNGSVMRCWPVSLAHWHDQNAMLADSRLQSRVTHPHPECEAGSAFVSAAIFHLLRGVAPPLALARAQRDAELPEPLRLVIDDAPARRRDELASSGWVRHTLESAAWGLLSTGSFEEAIVQVVNLGGDADTAGAVVGALAGAAYGLRAVPGRWREALQGEWPLGSGIRCSSAELIQVADRLVGIGE